MSSVKHFKYLDELERCCLSTAYLNLMKASFTFIMNTLLTNLPVLTLWWSETDLDSKSWRWRQSRWSNHLQCQKMENWQRCRSPPRLGFAIDTVTQRGSLLGNPRMKTFALPQQLPDERNSPLRRRATWLKGTSNVICNNFMWLNPIITLKTHCIKEKCQHRDQVILP